MTDNPYPVDSSGIAAAEVDIADDVIAKIAAIEASAREVQR